MATAVLVGIGSRASGDDAVGLVLVEQQRETPEVGVEIWEDRDALDVAGALVELGERDGQVSVVLVDCAEMGLAPGSWRAFDLNDAALAERAGGSSVHGVGLADGLALARALGFENPVRIFAVQPFAVDPGRLSLSLAMATRLPSLRAALADELAVFRQARPSDGGAPLQPEALGRAS